MSALVVGEQGAEVWCDAIVTDEDWVGSADGYEYCRVRVIEPTFALAQERATREGWDTVSTVTVLDGVERKRVTHFCPAHKDGVA